MAGVDAPDQTVVDRLRLEIRAEPDVDRSELMELTAELRARLLRIAEIEDVAPVADPVPVPGTKSGGALLPGVLTVAATLGTVVVTQVFQTVRSWLEHRPVLSVVVREPEAEFEISGSPEDVDRQVGRLLEHRRRAEGTGAG